MSKLDISISSIKYSLDVSDEEREAFIQLAKILNEKTNKLMMRTGKISDRLLLFILVLINLNKQEKLFSNFEENIIKLLKKASIFLQNKENLDSQLVLAGIITQNETQALPEYIDESKKNISSGDLLEPLEKGKEIEENYKETIAFIDDVLKVIEKLANNINML